MEQAFLIALISLAIYYAFWMARFAWGLRYVLWRDPATSFDTPFVSVVVAARNEEATIETCLHSILANDYPADRLEVIVVDDGSTDETAERVSRVQSSHAHNTPGRSGLPDEPHLRLLTVPDRPDRQRAHKKLALEAGIAAARGTIILTTDADCTVSTIWVRSMVETFTKRTAFVSGPVLYRERPGLFARMQRLEFLGLVAVGAGAIGSGRPAICNGANVAFRRTVYDEVGGYRGIDHLSSGDDELLMQKIARLPAWEVRFCSSPHAIVVTDPSPTLRAFLEQRRRWASKGRHYARPSFVASLVLVYLFYLFLLGGLVALPFQPALWPGVGAAFLLKMVPESLLLAPAHRHFRAGRWRVLFILAQLVQTVYILVAATLGLGGGYQWKGRRLDR